MQLLHLEVRDLRCVRALTLEPSPGLNVILGANGSGKTSLLEALHVLGTGRSFRTSGLADLVAREGRDLSVFGRLREPGGQELRIGVERGPGGTRIRMDGGEVRSASRLARSLPLVLITPDSQRLLSDGSPLRRRLLDWMLFHVEPDYHGWLERYRRTLRQRNTALREGGAGGSLAPWERELARLGEQLHACRARHMAEVGEILAATVARVAGTEVQVAYERGWEADRPLEQVLADSRAADLARGYTGRGAHRADLRFRVRGSAAQHVLSRGEGKLFVVAVLLSQLRYLGARLGRRPLLLVDDLASELDAQSRRRFLAEAQATGAQVFVTAVSAELVETGSWSDLRLFHVERGALAKVV